jgi:hypothetical protein
MYRKSVLKWVLKGWENRFDPSGFARRLASGCLELSTVPLDPIKNGKYLAWLKDWYLLRKHTALNFVKLVSLLY